LTDVLKVKVGRLLLIYAKAVSRKIISLKDYYGKKNIVISFVPAAWTPVCSDQWPGYNIVKDIFDNYDSILLGITVDNIPTLYSWTNQMGKLWFEVLSDFGRMALWQKNSVYCDLMVLQREHFS